MGAAGSAPECSGASSLRLELPGFVHPASGEVFWLILPMVNIMVFSLALARFATEVGAGTDMLLIDRAGWHLSHKVSIPEGHFLPLPPYSPELQPAERLWSLTDEPLENRYFETIEELELTLADRCVVLQHQPEVIKAHTCFNWLPA